MKENKTRPNWFQDEQGFIDKNHISFPVTLEDALRAWMPDEKHADRLPLYREHLHQSLNFDGYRPSPRATEMQVQECLAKKNDEWFDLPKFFCATTAFLIWLPKHKQDIRKKRAKKAAKARWSKKKI